MIKREVVCVLGMHRSGTSAMTKVLNILGINLGETDKLMKPGSDNPKGYWENEDIVYIHTQILNLYSRTWDSTQPLPHEWWKTDEILPYRNRLIEIIQKNFFNRDLWMWKDPRTSLLIPLWLEILKDLGITPLFVICVRNPLDVYLSLEKRNQFSKDKSLKLWNLYTLSALFWTKHYKRTIVHFDSLLDDTEGTLKRISNDLNILWPKKTAKVYNKINAFIDQKLRHSQSSIDQLMNTEGLLIETKVLYLALLKAIKAPSTQFDKIVYKLYHSLFLCIEE